jgi:VanZ family protein
MTPAPKPFVRPWMARLLAVATVAYTGVMVFATHYPRPEELLGPNAPPDKTLHFVAYAVFAALAAATWLTVRRTAHRSIAPLAIALAGFGAIDEITQPFFRRHADPLDWVYDCIGIAIGIATVVSAVALVRRFARAQ